MTENWRLCNSNADYRNLCDKLGLCELTVRLLANRGYKEETDIRKYLFPSFDDILPADMMKDMSRGVGLVAGKIESKSRIRIIGDYDVDGVTATYILYQVLKNCGADVDYRIPDRIKEGYGLNINLIEEAVADGIDTILTCDNGISAVDEIAYAKAQGMTVVVTDHHEVPELLPAADAIINPKQKDCDYPYKEICGAVVAAKFADRLSHKIKGTDSIIQDYIGEMALATVCDVMELTGENRAIVKLGLDALRTYKKPGLCKLLEYNNLLDKEITTTHLGYVIGPCLNATGRLDSAKRGVELLLVDNEKSAEATVLELLELNDQRKSMTDYEVERAIELVCTKNYAEDKVIVLYLGACHESIAGIIAGRIRDRFYRPVIIFTDSENGIKGSGRSIEGYHMYDSLVECADLLDKFGGHELAAGMSMKLDKLDEMRLRLNERCELTELQLMPKVLIDGIVQPGLLNIKMVQEISMLEPFGKGNRKPLLSMKHARVKRISNIGKTGNYLKLILLDGNAQFTALYFNDGTEMKNDIIRKYGEAEVENAFCGKENAIDITIAYNPSINEYKGNVDIQLVINNYRLN